MGYYYKHEYIFSCHGLQRCKERLKLKNLEDCKVKEKVLFFIKNSPLMFETKNDWYFQVQNTSFYIVVRKDNKLIITCSKVSVERQMSLLNNDW